MLVARQVEGEYIFVRGEKAFTSAEQATAYLQQVKGKYADSNGKPKMIGISTPNGTANCICEIGAFELTLEE